MAKEDEGDYLDEDIELEDKEKALLPTSTAFHVPSFSTMPPEATPSPPIPPRRPRNAHQKAKRRAAAQARGAAGEIKPSATQHAQNAKPIKIKDFNASSLPVSSTGWTGKQFTGGLGPVWRNLQALISMQGFKLLDWDGR